MSAQPVRVDLLDLSIKPEKAWYRQFWPWFLIILPASVVVACLFTIKLAIQYGDTVVRDDYYKDGLAINESIARDRLAISLGLSGVLEIAQEEIILQLSGIDIDAVSATFHHPFDADLDITTLLVKTESEGFYRSNQFVQKQRWYVELTPLAEDVLSAGDWKIQAEQDFRNSSFLVFGER